MSEYATNGAMLECTCGMMPTPLTVTGNMMASAQGQNIATINDKAPMANIKPFGQCKMKPTISGFAPCVPAPTAWTGFVASVQIMGGNPLLKTSTMLCGGGGMIKFKDSGQKKSAKVVVNPSSPQITSLQAAAIAGTPFCEECEKRKVQKEPKIIDIYWMDENQTPRQASELRPGQVVTLYVQVEEGAEGKTVDVNIASQSEMTVCGGQSSLKLKGLPVDSGNLAYVENFSIDIEDSKITDNQNENRMTEKVAESDSATETQIVARGKVYFNKDGQETECVKSNTEFETWVESESDQGTIYNGKYYEKAIMPKIIQNSEHASRHKVFYQQYDHEIAALTHLFNRWLRTDISTLNEKKIFPLQYPEIRAQFKLPLFNKKAGSVYVGGGSYTKMPSELDPTLVKAICMRESRCNIGKTTTDIMQVNNSGDWDDSKQTIGLSKGGDIEPATSVKAGILWLYGKGIMNVQKYYVKNLQWTSDGWDYRPARYDDIVPSNEKNRAELNVFSWKKSGINLASGTINSDWQFVAREYNGSSTKDVYLAAIDKYYKEAITPQSNDYYVDAENYIIP